MPGHLVPGYSSCFRLFYLGVVVGASAPRSVCCPLGGRAHETTTTKDSDHGRIWQRGARIARRTVAVTRCRYGIRMM